MPEYRPAYVALGSNLDDPVAQIERATHALAALPLTRLRRRSQLYANPPMGPQDQPEYVNAVAALETALAPLALLDALQAIETEQGRTRSGPRWGARTLDLDLLLYDDLEWDDPRLTLPHPGLHERDFVLYPLAEIAPQLAIPGREPLVALLAQCPSRGLRPLDRADD
ncbi:2-amino-4-hydroxy-6-hydroxymethyldihydropteridine diphosphokinase [Acidihalobacter aeolianus]|uniref:2-amino-4-hydroxy-6-hydroxymethyldihydropteridine pyrophosphokinase n=1 Tax=Acidihalobacter aeolianus TaxID=2792603 RepID=A0A1D8K6K4_9GAMM|nr:2-amino-4-hydroxy-6-hydroxymethyldihydropteridine diphosphokinase [Acidihalobacter aeolianus]AOV16584.1 2-amino-4-hydroxy-6-hydroxymethyldihydropteridine diphosphokinase [Acidihalobacter aeolianus]